MSVFYGICAHCCLPLKSKKKSDFCRECSRKSAKQRMQENIKESKELPERDKDEGFSDIRIANVAKRCKVIDDNGSITITLISLFGGRNQVKRVVTEVVSGDFDVAKQIAIVASKKLHSMKAIEAFKLSIAEVLGDEE